MPTTRPRVPGWHPDPDDPSSLRHWDGRKWGRERRPRPSWAPLPRQAGLVAGAPEPAPEPAGGGSRRRWYVVAGGALVLALLFVSIPFWLGSGTAVPPRTIEDEAFVDGADAACKEALPDVARSRPQSKEETGTPAQFGARIDRAADQLGRLVADLRAVPAAGDDRADVDAWLADWDAYVATGHRYAEAVRAEDRAAQSRVSAEATTLERKIFLFAKGNDMPSCFQLSRSEPGKGAGPI